MGVCILLAVAFRVLTPTEASAMKIGTIEDPARAFASFAEGYDAVAAERMPRPNLLQTWRKLGIPVYQKVAFDGEGSAEFFRKQCGFLPFADEADGILLDADPARLPPGWQAALAAAREDVRILGRLSDLAAKCRASANHKHVLEGRRACSWLCETPFLRENADTLRLEAVGLVRHLEKLLGEKPLACDGTPAKTEPNTLDFVPFKGQEVGKVRLEAFGKSVELAPGLTLTPAAHGVTVTFSDKRGAFDPLGLPPGRDTFRVKLYLPTRGPSGWERHDVVLTAPHKPTPRVDSSCTDGLSIDIEDRFADCTPRAYELPSRTWSEDYQRLHLPRRVYSFAARDKDQKQMTGWTLSFTIWFSDIVGQWPYAEDARRNLWYLAVDRLPDGSDGKAFRLQFPRGNERTQSQICAAFHCETATEAWGEDSAAVVCDWQATEIGRLLPVEETGVVHRFSRTENALFWSRMVEPVYRRAARSAETAFSNRDKPRAKFMDLPPAKQAAFVAASGPYRHICEITSRLRRDFLLMRQKGETPPEPKPDALSEEADRLKKPASLEAEEGESMSLDEEDL